MEEGWGLGLILESTSSLFPKMTRRNSAHCEKTRLLPGAVLDPRAQVVPQAQVVPRAPAVPQVLADFLLHRPPFRPPTFSLASFSSRPSLLVFPLGRLPHVPLRPFCKLELERAVL